MSELYTVTAEEGRLRFLPRTDAALEQAVLDESPLPGCGFVSRLGDPGLLHCVVFRHERKPGGVFVVEDDNGLLFAAVAETNLAYAVALGPGQDDLLCALRRRHLCRKHAGRR